MPILKRPNNRPWWLIARLLLFGVPIVMLAIWYGRSVGQDFKEFEHWIGQLGIWGPLVLILATGVLSVLLFPETPFAMIAGALFGMVWGPLVALAGAALGASLAFWVSRLLLRDRVGGFLDGHPRWSAIERAASHEGARLQLLMRLTPLNSALLSYVMGASRLAYSAFLVGCIGLIPSSIVEAYFGYIASHFARLASGTSEHSLISTVSKVIGLIGCVAVMAYVTRLARRSIAESDANAAAAMSADPAE